MIARLHHVGFVVRSIERAADGFAASLMQSWTGEVFEDPVQKVRVTFLVPEDSTQPQFELVEPGEEASPVRRFLEKQGGGLHHVCYEAADLDAEIERIRGAGAALVQRPVPAVAFQGRRIAWVYTRQRLLVEYLEL